MCTMSEGHLSQVPVLYATLRARRPILNHCKTNCSTDPRSARKVTSANSRILPRSPDWQLINLPWLQSLLPGDRAWARAEDSPMPGCVHPRWSTCLDQTLSTGRGQDGKDQKKGGRWGFRRAIKQNKSLPVRVCLYWVGVQMCVTRR